MFNRKTRVFVLTLALLSLVLSVFNFAAVAQDDVVTIRWQTQSSGESEQAVYQAINDAINERLPNIEVVYDPAPLDGYQDSLLTELSSGTAPDIVWVPGTTFSSFASRNVFVDLVPLLEADDELSADDFFPSVMEEITNEGRIFGLPRDVGTLAVYYNIDLFEAAGLDTPRDLQEAGEWTWEAMYDAALVFANMEGENASGFGVTIPFWWGSYLNMIRQAGGDLFNEDRDACGLNTEATVEALEFLQLMYEGDGDNPAVSPQPGSDAADGRLFLSGQVAMRWDGRWATPFARALAPFNWDVVELPSGSAGPANTAFWGAFAIPTSTDNLDAAYTVLRELVSVETQTALIETGTIMPSRVSDETTEAFEAATPPENAAGFLNSMEYATPEQSLWNIDMNRALFAVLEPEVQRVMVGELTPQEFADTICEQIDPLFR